MTAQMLPDLGAPYRRVDGNRDAPGQQDPEKAEEVFLAGRQHDGDAFAGL